MKNEPVLMALLVPVLLEAGGAVERLATNHTTAGIFLAAGAFLTGVGGAVARSLVSPVSRPPAASGPVIRERERY